MGSKKIISMTRTGIRLRASSFGNPEEVVCMENETVDGPGENEVLLQMLMSPVNPVDINTIEGKYAFRPTVPYVPGTDGVARVLETGPGVKKLRAGDHVIPLKYFGTWKTHIVSPEDGWMAVPTDLGLVEAATLSINPPTAYRLLKDFVDLNSGDTVIQNGANSSCGQLIIQICKIWGINTVNVIRDRPDLEQLKSFLTDLGATYVFTEAEVQKTDIFNANKIKRPKLASNCIGGTSASNIMKHLDFGGTIVTYGGMSKQPISVSTSALVFKGIDIKGLNISRTLKNLDENKKTEMFNELISMYSKGDLKASPYNLVNCENYKMALANTITSQGKIGQKFLIDFRMQ